MKKMKKMEKMKVLCALIVFGASVLVGCSKKPSAEINVFIWTEYLPQEVADNFLKENNVKVNIATYSSAAEMYAKVKSSPADEYDVICATEFYITLLANDGLIGPLDKDNIPNIKNIDPFFLNKYYDKGNVYSVPYLCSLAPIVVNRDAVPESVTVKSYADLFQPAFEKKLVLLDNMQIIIGSLNRMLGFDYNETDPAKLAQTEQWLLKLKPYTAVLDADAPNTSLVDGTCSAGIIWSGAIVIAMESLPHLEIVYPPEGYNIMLDSLTIAKATKNKEWAEKFVNYILDPQVSALITKAYPYTNPNKAALEVLGPEYVDNPARNPSEEVLEGGFENRNQTPEVLAIYDDMWTKFKKE